jgi:hypothetical protein
MNYLIVRPGTRLAETFTNPTHYHPGLFSALSDFACRERMNESAATLEEMATMPLCDSNSTTPDSSSIDLKNFRF